MPSGRTKKSSWNETSLRGLFGILMVLFGAASGFADDVGITKARLVQKTERSYALEADVTQALVWAIKAPVFPDRFEVSKLEYINQAGWIVVLVVLGQLVLKAGVRRLVILGG